MIALLQVDKLFRGVLVFVFGCVFGSIIICLWWKSDENTLLQVARPAKHRSTRAVNTANLGRPRTGSETRLRLLCFVTTSPRTLYSRAYAVNMTWARRCDHVVFVSDEADAAFPAIGVGSPPGYAHLTAKTMATFDLLYDRYLHDYDWFLKADDDTYVIVENLRLLLGRYAPYEPLMFGYAFQLDGAPPYVSGGAGYVISREALMRFGSRHRDVCADDGGSEDVQFSACMLKLGVRIGDSRDRFGRSRFHCFNIYDQLHVGQMKDWIFKWSKHNVIEGVDGLSAYPISFHYMTEDNMYDLEYFAYHLRVYGDDADDAELS